MSKELPRFGLSLEVGDLWEVVTELNGVWISVQKFGALLHHPFWHAVLAMGSSS